MFKISFECYEIYFRNYGNYSNILHSKQKYYNLIVSDLQIKMLNCYIGDL